MDALRSVLDPALAPPATDELRIWWAATAERRAAWADAHDRALVAGACADRLGFAFTGGYSEALRVLVPGLPPGTVTALCATEEGGAHPRAIRTRLVETSPGRHSLTGRKVWATAASAAASLLVVASVGEVDGKNRLRVARVPANAPGLRMHPASAPFIPEISHAQVELDGVEVGDADILPGDGYDDYLKPFRTVEDIYVHTSLAGYLLGVARRHGFSRELVEGLTVLVVALRTLAHADPKADITHVALAGAIELNMRLVGELEAAWAGAPDDEWARWQRDRALLRVAGKARAARRERAWEWLGA